MGTPEFAVPALHAVASACDVVAVVTPPDRPRGRGLENAPCAVAAEAERLSLPVVKTADVGAPDEMLKLRALAADLFAVVAFGTILSPELLAAPKLGSINLHGSMLPEYRGASPVQRALWDGRTATGVTTLWMDSGIDTGDLILQRWVAIEPEDDAGTLASRLSEAGAPLLADSLVLAYEGRAPRAPQDRAAGSYAGKLGKSDGAIDWSLDAQAVWNRQRAVTPWPGAATAFRGRRMLIAAARPRHLLAGDQPPGTLSVAGSEGVEVACGRGALLVTRVKPEGRAELAAHEWARGARLERGERFEQLKEVLA